MAEEFREQIEEIPEQHDMSTEQEPKLKSAKFEEIKKLIRQEAEEQGVDLDVMASLFGSTVIETVNGAFNKRYGLSLPEKDLPKVLVGKIDINGYGPAIFRIDQDSEAQEQNFIFIRDVDSVLSGNIMSEEVAHVYRYHLAPKGDKREEITSEFFGFLGRRLFGKAAQEGYAALSDLEDNERGINSKKQLVGVIRALGRKVNANKAEFKDVGEGIIDPQKKKKVQEGIDAQDRLFKEFKDSFRDDIIHQRGYEWASRVDLDKITDWEKLFSMPNAEVRKRFFTDKQDYSGL